MIVAYTVFVVGALIFCVAYIVVLIILALPFRLPFVRSRNEKVEAMLRMLGDVKGKRVVDLGSGDGKVVEALAQAGADASGIELNPILVLWSRIRMKRLSKTSRGSISHGNFFKRNLGGFEGYVIYGIPKILPELEEKLLNEVSPGGRIVMHRFSFPNWKPHASEGDVYLYIKN